MVKDDTAMWFRWLVFYPLAVVAAAMLVLVLYSPADDRIALEVRDNLTVRIPLDVWEPKP